MKKIKNIFEKHDFVMTTAELKAYGMYYSKVQKLIKDGFVEKVKNGYYHWVKDFNGSEISIINRLFPDAVLSAETALFYYGYSDRNPAAWHFAINKNVAKERTNIDYPFIKPYRTEPELLVLGETTGKIDGFPVRIYDRDRTICDVLRNMNKMDKEIFNKAIQGYVNDTKKNIPNLMEYAKKLRVQTKVKELIGVWL